MRDVISDVELLKRHCAKEHIHSLWQSNVNINVRLLRLSWNINWHLIQLVDAQKENSSYMKQQSLWIILSDWPAHDFWKETFTAEFFKSIILSFFEYHLRSILSEGKQSWLIESAAGKRKDVLVSVCGGLKLTKYILLQQSVSPLMNPMKQILIKKCRKKIKN